MDSEQLPIIIDVEASGFGRESYPIEVGLALEDGATRCFLIQPEPHWSHWDPESENLHGITREILLKFGRTVEEVSQILNDLLDGKTVYSDGWLNDQTWLHLLFETANQRLRFRIETLPTLLSEAQMDLWDSSKRQMLDKYKFRRHRASNDALLLQRTWESVCKQ